LPNINTAVQTVFWLCVILFLVLLLCSSWHFPYCGPCSRQVVISTCITFFNYAWT